MEVFNHPVNTFVASFIGSPPMNLIPGRLHGGEVQFSGGGAVPVPERLKEHVRGGQEVIFGVGPMTSRPSTTASTTRGRPASST